MTTPATTDKNNDNDNNNSNNKSYENRQHHDMPRTTTITAGKVSEKMREENIWHTLRRAKSLTDFSPIFSA
ncbi:uncharacterized protein LOC119548134 [Drosophila subpulchrella]|uniref:uncharacterized protein LOC119548134 n=1 Tax=Drosophila subpulchrella TaxID=1486046 RepID=UPI0018A1406E|nr:uncharacterized protein LOC119548134 [Drosophila subpulchrella]